MLIFFWSTIATKVGPNTPFCINHTNPIEYQKNAYAPNAVAPNVLSCLKSFIHAINWALAPKNIAHGNTSETPDVIPNFWDDATNVITANPKIIKISIFTQRQISQSRE